MTNRPTLSITVAAILTTSTLAAASAEEAQPSTDGKSAWSLTTIPSSNGPTSVLVKTFSLPTPNAQGSTGERPRIVALLPANNAIWAGSPGTHLFVFGEGIAGMDTAASASGGVLLVRVSTNRLALPAGAAEAEVDQAAARYLSSITNAESFLPPVVARLQLSDLVGRGPLMDLERGEMPKPPAVSRVVFEGPNIVVSLKSSTGNHIVLRLDQQLEVVSATANETLTFERGGRKPPSLQQELRERAARARKSS